MNVGDLNGNGALDVVAVQGWTSLWVMVNQGNGTLAAPVELAPDIEDLSIAALADMNGDGRLDIVAWEGYNLHVLLNTCAP